MGTASHEFYEESESFLWEFYAWRGSLRNGYCTDIVRYLRALLVQQMIVPPLGGVTIRHWQSGEVVALGMHEALNLLEYRWSPDGQWLAATGDDGTLRVWPVLYER